MVALPIYGSPRGVDVIDEALAVALPTLPRHVRFEAMARGLGYADGNSLHAVSTDRKPAPVDSNGQAFASYLTRLDYQAEASTFYEAATLSALHMVTEFLPLLGRSGYGPFVEPAHFGEDPDELIAADRAALRSPVSVPGFLQAMDFLQSACCTTCINPTASSYALKHIAERRRPSYSDGNRIGSGYVANGEMIAAGIYHGLKWSLDEASGSRDMLFNVDIRKVEKLERRAMRLAMRR